MHLPPVKLEGTSMGCSDLWTLNLVGILKCLFCSVYKQKILLTKIEMSHLETLLQLYPTF